MPEVEPSPDELEAAFGTTDDYLTHVVPLGCVSLAVAIAGFSHSVRGLEVFLFSPFALLVGVLSLASALKAASVYGRTAKLFAFGAAALGVAAIGAAIYAFNHSGGGC